MSLDLTVTDLFCGAGGSSIGAEKAGATLRMAANHWQLAVDTHNSNFPHADHDCADISKSDPRRYPKTDVLLASPECTYHSQARSKKHEPNLFNPDGDPAAERSRATMWDVPRFAEHNRYQLVIVENVVEISKWAPFNAWIEAMRSLGYEHKILSLNSMVAHPTPQSRDRLYVVFWRKENRAPDLEIRPQAWCPKCEVVCEAIQVFKKQGRFIGKFRSQYLYRCPMCMEPALPLVWPAASAIDWALAGERIGDRKKPLAEKTMRRIQVGLEKFGAALVQTSGHTFERPGYYRTWPVTLPMPTQMGEVYHSLVVPLRTHGTARVVSKDPLPTIVAGNVGTALVVPVHHGEDGPAARPVSLPWPTQTGRQELALVAHLRGTNDKQIEGSVRSIDDVLGTVTGGGIHHALIVKNYGKGDDPSMTKSPDEPLGAVTARDHHSVLGLPFVVDYHGNGRAHSVEEPLGTQHTKDVHALVESGIDVDDCTFRMLEPHEIGKAMAFPDDYIVLGNKRDRVRQFGNAVTPPVMDEIVRRGVESLA